MKFVFLSNSVYVTLFLRSVVGCYAHSRKSQYIPSFFWHPHSRTVWLHLRMWSERKDISYSLFYPRTLSVVREYRKYCPGPAVATEFCVLSFCAYMTKNASLQVFKRERTITRMSHIVFNDVVMVFTSRYHGTRRSWLATGIFFKIRTAQLEA